MTLSPEGRQPGDVVQVRLHAQATESGTLELLAVSNDNGQRWKVEFDVRATVNDIDLGTTNTVLAYCAPGSDEVKLFDIDQLVAPGEVGTAALLPSLRYHPAEGELAAGELQLPWRDPDVAGVAEMAGGRLARKLGAQVPGRLVASAKSWLSHPN
eukprot:gene34046-35007_t